MGAFAFAVTYDTGSSAMPSAATGTASTSTAAPPSTGVPHERPLVSVIGDSYTLGSSMGGTRDHGWAAIVFEDLSADVAVEARDGSGYVSGVEHGVAFGQLVESISPESDVVIVFGSGNDMSCTPDEVEAAALSLLGEVRMIAPLAKVVMVGTPWPTADFPDNVRAIRDRLYRVAGDVGVTFVDPLAERWFWDEPGLIGTDGVHPTDAGHAYMAAQLRPVILASLPD